MKASRTAAAAAALTFALAASTAGVALADPAVPPTPPGPPPGPTPVQGDGTYAVGTDIQPGTYASAGPLAGAGACYWKRLGGPTGADILDNALTKKPQVVRIEPTDKAFKTSGCEPWLKTDAAIPAPEQVPPWLAPWQLRGYIDQINAGASQMGPARLPTP